MPDRADEIVQEIFVRASADLASAPLASSFARAFAEDRWTTEVLDANMRAFVERAALPVAEHEREAVE